MRARGWRGLRLGLVVLDFDGTLTVRDTIEEVVAAAIDGAARHRSAAVAEGEGEEAVAVLRQRKQREWAELVAAYTGPYRTFVDHLLQSPQPLHASGDVSHLRQLFLEEDDVERKSVERVEAARLLEGLSSRDWRELGRRMASIDLLHARAVECVRRLQRESASAGGSDGGGGGGGVELHALSANWSKDYLVGALDGLIDERHIRTNELIYDPDTELSTGQMKMQVVSALDKQRYIQQLREKAHDRPNNRVLYVGDTLNDAMALLEADYGVLMGGRHTVTAVLRAHNVELRPLARFDETQAADQEPNDARVPVVWQASDWGELVSWLFPDETNDERRG